MFQYILDVSTSVGTIGPKIHSRSGYWIKKLIRSNKYDCIHPETIVEAARGGYYEVIMMLCGIESVDPAVRNSEALRVASENINIRCVEILSRDPRMDKNVISQTYKEWESMLL